MTTPFDVLKVNKTKRENIFIAILSLSHFFQPPWCVKLITDWTVVLKSVSLVVVLHE